MIGQNEYEILWKCKTCGKVIPNRGVIFHGKPCVKNDIASVGTCKATEHPCGKR